MLSLLKLWKIRLFGCIVLSNLLSLIMNEFFPAFSDHEKRYSYYVDFWNNQDFDSARSTCENVGYTLNAHTNWNHMWVSILYEYCLLVAYYRHEFFQAFTSDSVVAWESVASSYLALEVSHAVRFSDHGVLLFNIMLPVMDINDLQFDYPFRSNINYRSNQWMQQSLDAL